MWWAVGLAAAPVGAADLLVRLTPTAIAAAAMTATPTVAIRRRLLRLLPLRCFIDRLIPGHVSARTGHAEIWSMSLPSPGRQPLALACCICRTHLRSRGIAGCLLPPRPRNVPGYARLRHPQSGTPLMKGTVRSVGKGRRFTQFTDQPAAMPNAIKTDTDPGIVMGVPVPGQRRHAGTSSPPRGCPRCASPDGRFRSPDRCRTTPVRVCRTGASRRTG